MKIIQKEELDGNDYLVEINDRQYWVCVNFASGEPEVLRIYSIADGTSSLDITDFDRDIDNEDLRLLSN